MKLKGKAIASAWIMLSIYATTIIFAGLHQHQLAAETCNDCKHYIHHSGHISQNSEAHNECVLCQFINILYTASTTVAVVFLSTFAVITITYRRSFATTGWSSSQQTRGSPCFCFI